MRGGKSPRPLPRHPRRNECAPSTPQDDGDQCRRGDRRQRRAPKASDSDASIRRTKRYVRTGITLGGAIAECSTKIRFDATWAANGVGTTNASSCATPTLVKQTMNTSGVPESSFGVPEQFRSHEVFQPANGRGRFAMVKQQKYLDEGAITIHSRTPSPAQSYGICRVIALRCSGAAPPCGSVVCNSVGHTETLRCWSFLLCGNGSNEHTAGKAPKLPHLPFTYPEGPIFTEPLAVHRSNAQSGLYDDLVVRVESLER